MTANAGLVVVTRGGRGEGRGRGGPGQGGGRGAAGEEEWGGCRARRAWPRAGAWVAALGGKAGIGRPGCCPDRRPVVWVGDLLLYTLWVWNLPASCRHRSKGSHALGLLHVVLLFRSEAAAGYTLTLPDETSLGLDLKSTHTGENYPSPTP